MGGGQWPLSRDPSWRGLWSHGKGLFTRSAGRPGPQYTMARAGGRRARGGDGASALREQSRLLVAGPAEPGGLLEGVVGAGRSGGQVGIPKIDEGHDVT